MPPADNHSSERPPEKNGCVSSAERAVVRVRRLRKEDIDAVMSIAAESPEAAAWSRESYQKLLKQTEGVALVAEKAEQGRGEAGRLQGFVIGRVNGAEAEVLNLAVSAGCRRCGSATALLRAALEEFVDCGAEFAYLEVRQSNTAALAFYAKNGFSRTGLRKGYYRSPDEPAVTMSKALEW